MIAQLRGSKLYRDRGQLHRCGLNRVVGALNLSRFIVM